MRKWILRGAVGLAVVVAVLAAASWVAARRFEPYVREQAIAYLKDRFETAVEIESLHVSVVFISPWHPLGGRLSVWGTGLRLPPVVAISRFRLETEVSALWEVPRHIREIRVQGLKVDIPPRANHSPASVPTIDL